MPQNTESAVLGLSTRVAIPALKTATLPDCMHARLEAYPIIKCLGNRLSPA